jgi:hypothetical protein
MVKMRGTAEMEEMVETEPEHEMEEMEERESMVVSVHVDFAFLEDN